MTITHTNKDGSAKKIEDSFEGVSVGVDFTVRDPWVSGGYVIGYGGGTLSTPPVPFDKVAAAHKLINEYLNGAEFKAGMSEARNLHNESVKLNTLNDDVEKASEAVRVAQQNLTDAFKAAKRLYASNFTYKTP